MDEQKNPNIMLESDLPTDLKTVAASPIIPSQQQTPPAAGDTLPPYFRGSIAQTLQHDVSLVKTGINPRQANTPLMPLGPSANPQNNAAIKSIVTQSVGASGSSVDLDPFMKFRGVWNNFTNYSVNDVVLFNQSSYVCIQANVNNEPDAPVGATISVRQTASAGSSGGGSLGVAFANPVLAGSAIIVSVISQNVGTDNNVKITDSLGNSYVVLAQSPQVDSNEYWNSTYIILNVKGGSVSVTATWPAGDTGPGTKYIVIAEVVGLAPFQPDQTSSTGIRGAFTTPPTFGIQCNSLTDLIFTAADNDNGALTAPSGFSSAIAGGSFAGIAWAQPTFVGTNPIAWGGGGFRFTAIAASLKAAVTTQNWVLIGENAVFNVPASATQFNPFEVIFFRGSMYVCLKPTISGPFTSPSSWALWAQGTGGINNNPGNYTPVSGDDGRLLFYSSGSAQTLTLPNPPPYDGFWFAVQNVGSGFLTINRNGANINGFASNSGLNQNQGILIWTDGTDWFTLNGFATVTNTTGTLTLNQVVLGNGGNDIKVQGSLGTVNQVLHGNASGPPSWSPVIELDQLLSDVTTDNVSTSQHGYAPKLPGDPTKFLNGLGQYVAPSGIVLSDASAAGTLITHTVSGVLRPGGVIPPAGKYRISADFFLQLNPSPGTLQFSFTYNDGTALRTVSPAPIDTSALNSGETDYVLQTDGIHDISWTMTLV